MGTQMHKMRNRVERFSDTGCTRQRAGCRRHRCAFTLIEILVVVAIIALLVAILLPSLKRVKDTSKDVVCRSNMRQILIGIATYAASARDRFPTPAVCYDSYDDDPTQIMYRVDPVGVWGYNKANRYSPRKAKQFFRYVQAEQAWICPMDSGTEGYETNYEDAPGLEQGFSYSLNARLHEDFGPAKTTTTMIKRPSSKIIAFEEATPNDGLCAWWAADDHMASRHRSKRSGGDGAYANKRLRGANMGFFDAHVDPMHEKDVWNNEILCEPFSD
jgi:prepilin-type N-terminal cleavage/methylation domain-containing protein/prepilin-type processing-associated H-X9-DG protein